MAVPAHDERDNEFAKKFKLEIIEVVEWKPESNGIVLNWKSINSDFLNWLNTTEAKSKMIEWLEENKVWEKKTNYKLRDWIFTRQRYWGEPIPLVHCEKCGIVPVDESELPLTLPEVEKYERWQRRRLSMKPGLTCLRQVNGRNFIDFNTWMKMDLDYIDNWDLKLDLIILLKTIPAVVFRKGAM